MAVSANQLAEISSPGRINLPVAAGKTLYAGTLSFEAAGLASDVIAAGANRFCGLVVSEASDTVGEGRVELRTNCDVLLSGSGFAAGDIGVACYASDNYTVTKTSTSNSVIGTVVEVLSASSVRVRLSIEA